MILYKRFSGIRDVTTTRNLTSAEISMTADLEDEDEMMDKVSLISNYILVCREWTCEHAEAYLQEAKGFDP